MPYIHNILEISASVIELTAAGILILGFLKTLVVYLHSEWRWFRQEKMQSILPLLRRQLGKYILLGLDFYIVSDIIHSMIRPGFEELINLAIIVLLRSAIGFFLGKEIAEIEKSEIPRLPRSTETQIRKL